MRAVALLRGINVGGKHKLPMADLKEVAAGLGWTDVETYVQSGNLLFATSARSEAAVRRALEAALAERFGFEVPVVVRTGAEMAAVVAADPFGDIATDGARYTVTFLPRPPDPDRVAALPPAERGQYRVAGRELYLWLPDGIAGTPLASWRWDTLLAVPGTTRNWNTVTTLAELAAV